MTLDLNVSVSAWKMTWSPSSLAPYASAHTNPACRSTPDAHPPSHTLHGTLVPIQSPFTAQMAAPLSCLLGLHQTEGVVPSSGLE